jgi:hypothetical protein
LRPGTLQQKKAYLLFFFVGVAEDDDFVIVGRPKNVAIEVTEELFGKLIIM